jgi:radical SAM-linked protein
MIGLPTEEEEDVRGIAETARRYLAVADHYHRNRVAEVTASVSSFVPKPHTPFHWSEMNDMHQIRAKQDLLMSLTRGTRVKLKWHDPKVSHLEAYLSRGDRRIAELVEYAFRHGCRFDGWGEKLNFEVWMRGIAELGIDRYAYLRPMPLDARLPWDHIDVGITADFLKKEYRRALQDRTSPPCGKPFRAKVHHTNLADARAEKKPLVCFDCGIACDMKKMREERIDFLTRLDAVERPEPSARQELPARGRDLEEIRDRNQRPRTRMENTVKISYRLSFSKQGREKFISHLDLVRLLPRVFRRAGVPLAYSLGFHPKPIMVFSPALTLGWGSRAEYLDVVLAEQVDPDALVERLRRVTPEGLWFQAARRLRAGDPPLSRVIDVCDYEVHLGEADRELLSGRLGAIAAGEPVVVRREREGRVLEADVSRAIVWARLVLRDGAAEEEVLSFRFLLASSPGARPGDVYHWLTGTSCPPQSVCRTGLWKVNGSQTISPLDLEALRNGEGALAAPAEPAREGG